jgi:hypothetical protein
MKPLQRLEHTHMSDINLKSGCELTDAELDLVGGGKNWADNVYKSAQEGSKTGGNIGASLTGNSDIGRAIGGAIGAVVGAIEGLFRE